MRCLVLGAQRCGKTALLQQLARFDNPLQRSYVPTIEDTYQIQTGIDANERPQELVIFHDTAGFPRGPVEVRRPHLSVADAIVLVYSVLNLESFERADALKKFIDKNLPKDKKEIPIVLVGTMIDLPGRQVDIETAATWASKERVKFFEVSAQDRASVVEIVHYLVGRHFHPISESLKTFHPITLIQLIDFRRGKVLPFQKADEARTIKCTNSNGLLIHF